MNLISLLLLLISTSTLLTTVSSDKILVMAFFSSKSHKITYMPLVEELGKRGHQITVLTPIPASGKMLNIKEILTYDLHTLLDKKSEENNFLKMKESGKELNPFTLLELFETVCRKTYSLPHVMALLEESFDLIILDPAFNDCALGFVHKLKAPLVLFYPAAAAQMLVSKIEGHFPPSFVPNVFLGYGDEMTFLERMKNFGVDLVVEGILRFYYEPAMEKIYREILGQDLPSVNEILGNTSLILSNGHFSLSGPKPLLPDVVDVGGIHSRPAKPLPKELEGFISKSGKDGFILFSMGSGIKTDQMTEVKRKIFTTVFSKLKQQVLWKWESETMPELPKNVKLSKWLPQQDVLGHPNIKMFITHCGLGSTEEAIYNGVPLIGIPMFGDQPMNAIQSKRQGYLVHLEWNELTEEKLLNAINEVLNNKKYSESVRRISKIFKDQPDSPLQRGTFWIEYVLRHKGAPHLRSAARKLNYFQYHSWDVIAAYFLIAFLIIRIIIAIFKFIFRKVCGSSEKRSPVVRKKNE